MVGTTISHYKITEKRSRDGWKLFYLSGNSGMVISVGAGGTSFRAGNPHQVFEDPLLWTSPFPEWDVAPDGKRFVVIREGTQEEAR